MASIDCLFCLLVAHVCMHFQILQKDLRALKKTDQDMNKEITRIIMKHHLILR